MEKIQQCTRCLMDNSSDKTIIFDQNGHCNYCNDAILDMKNIYFPNEEGKKSLRN